MHPVDLKKFGDADALAAAAADFIVAAAREAILERARFTLVLTGGATPEKTYRMLAQANRASVIDWRRTYLFVGDERVVPDDDSRSNFGMARRSLLDHVAVPKENLFPMSTAAGPAEGARLYGELLGRFFQQPPDSLPAPAFDLVLLGLGEDGHVASLFPGMAAVQVTDRWVTWSPPGTLPPPVDRITLTMPVLKAARAVLFLVSGKKKADVVERVLKSPPDPLRLPASAVRPNAGRLHWFVDEDAARKLA